MIQLSHHQELMLAEDNDPFIGRSVLATGEFEFWLVQRAIDVLGKRALFVDVGANIGTACIPAVARDLAAIALAFEPDPHNYRLLCCNTILNGVNDRIGCVNAAVGDRMGTVTLTLAPDNLGDHRIAAGDEAWGRPTVDVDMLTLLAAAPDLSSRDLVWLDVQGYESHVLAGAGDLAARGVPVVLEVSLDHLDDYNTRHTLISQLSAYSTFIDLRADVTPRPVDELAAFIGSIPAGCHRDLLMQVTS